MPPEVHGDQGQYADDGRTRQGLLRINGPVVECDQYAFERGALFTRALRLPRRSLRGSRAKARSVTTCNYGINSSPGQGQRHSPRRWQPKGAWGDRPCAALRCSSRTGVNDREAARSCRSVDRPSCGDIQASGITPSAGIARTIRTRAGGTVASSTGRRAMGRLGLP
jgi:hypothetical protein